MSGHNKAFIIRFYRKKFNITQEELADQICSPVTIARYENGIIDPSDRQYQQIMDKLGRKDESVIFNIQTRNLFFSAIRDNLLALFEKRQFSEAKLQIEELRKDKTLSDFYYENRQFIERIENNILLEQGEISIKKFITKMEELLRLSYPEYHAKSFITKAVYTENELLILNNLATSYGQIGEFQTGENIFKQIINQINTLTVETYKPIYLLLINYSNMLGLNGFFDKSINICNQGIKWLQENNRSNYLYNFYYNIGWNLMEKYKRQPLKKMLKQKAKVYIWEAYQLCKLFKESDETASLIKKFYDDIEKL